MKKSNSKNVVIIILSIAVVALLIFTIYQNFFSGLNNTPPLEEPDKDLVVSIEDYTVFDLEDAPFKFVVASVKFASNEPINIELQHLQTNENVVLNAVDSYRKAIEDKGYNLTLMEVATADLVSLENTLTTNLFIPVKSLNTNSIQLRFSSDLQDTINGVLNPIVIDLSNPTGTPEMLGKVGVDEPTNGETPNNEDFNDIVFGDLIEVDPNLLLIANSNGTLSETSFSSNSRLFTVKVVINSSKEIGIESARITLKGTSTTFDALESQYVFRNGNNMIGDTDYFFEGYLLFQVFSNDPYATLTDDMILLEYKLFGSDQWITVGE